MGDGQFEQLIMDAEEALANNDKAKARTLAMQVLSNDLSNDRAWYVLYCGFDTDQPFEKFQQQIINQYFTGAPQSVSKLCPTCGKPLKQGSKFCIFCGKPVEPGAATSNARSYMLQPDEPRRYSSADTSTSQVKTGAQVQGSKRPIKGFWIILTSLFLVGVVSFLFIFKEISGDPSSGERPTRTPRPQTVYTQAAKTMIAQLTQNVAIETVTPPDSESISPSQDLVSNAVPMPPVPFSPVYSSLLQTSEVTFSWGAAQNATDYMVIYTGPVNGESAWSSAQSVPINGFTNGEYQWQVFARNSFGVSEPSEVWTFTVALPPNAPELVSPINSASLNSNYVTFRWNEAYNAIEYYLEYSGASNGASGWFTGTAWGQNDLPYGSYTWRVKSRNAGGESSWSATGTFVLVGAPSAPVLSSPANGTSSMNQSVTFSWSPISGASEYYAELSGPANFNTGWTSSTSFTLNNLYYGTYSWRVKSRNQAAESSWSETSSFTITSPPVDVWVHVKSSGFEYSSDGWVEIGSQNTLRASQDANAVYTQTRAVGYTNDADWVRWRPTISTTGTYRVCIFAPLYTNTAGITNLARYTIHSANGDFNSTEYPTRQSDYSGGWMDLGLYYFSAGTDGYVYMGDYTGDNPEASRVINQTIYRLSDIKKPRQAIIRPGFVFYFTNDFKMPPVCQSLISASELSSTLTKKRLVVPVLRWAVTWIMAPGASFSSPAKE